MDIQEFTRSYLCGELDKNAFVGKIIGATGGFIRRGGSAIARGASRGGNGLKSSIGKTVQRGRDLVSKDVAKFKRGVQESYAKARGPIRGSSAKPGQQQQLFAAAGAPVSKAPSASVSKAIPKSAPKSAGKQMTIPFKSEKKPFWTTGRKVVAGGVGATGAVGLGGYLGSRPNRKQPPRYI